MVLKPLRIKDKLLFVKYLNLEKHFLSAYAFSNIYIQKSLYNIYWVLIKENLCIFFKDKTGAFLYLPPLGKDKDGQLIKEVFCMLKKLNKNKLVARIENIEEQDMPFYQNLGYRVTAKYPDYLYLREDLVNLKGNKFKSKRACINHFIKNYKYEVYPFTLKYRMACLKLYLEWMKKRMADYDDNVYRGLLKDNFKTLKFLFKLYNNLDLIGYVVKVGNTIKAFSLGYPLNEEVFCILYEITDLKIKGLAQFIFHYFCQKLSYRYINALDDAGLNNLRQTKLSYHPSQMVHAYLARENG